MTAWRPVALSGKQRKAINRRFGADVIVTWPEALPAPEDAPALNQSRPATEAEERAARIMTAQACAEHRLHVRWVNVATLARPHDFPRGRLAEPHLVIHLISQRWLADPDLPRRMNYDGSRGGGWWNC